MPYIENTTITPWYNSAGVHKQYWVVPNEGYVLHDKTLDAEEFDPDTFEPTGNVILGYTGMGTTCSVNYDFTANPREFYAVLRTSVPENQIFGGVDNDHEVM